jgi:hypothetical protein
LTVLILFKVVLYACLLRRVTLWSLGISLKKQNAINKHATTKQCQFKTLNEVKGKKATTNGYAGVAKMARYWHFQGMSTFTEDERRH